MTATPTPRTLGLLLSLGLCLPATAAAQAQPGDEGWHRPPQLAVELGGSWSRMVHPSTYVPTSRDLVRTVDARNGAMRLSGGLHFNILRGSDRNDLWWTNGVDWYLSGGDIEVLAFRPGLEKRFSLSRRLTLGVSAFGSAAEVAVPTGRMTTQQPDPGGAPQFEPNYYEAKAKKWVFGGGAAGALHLHFGRFLYTRVQAGYTQYVKKAEGFQVSSDLEGFSVSLSGPWAGALVGVNL